MKKDHVEWIFIVFKHVVIYWIDWICLNDQNLVCFGSAGIDKAIKKCDDRREREKRHNVSPQIWLICKLTDVNHPDDHYITVCF